MKIVHFQGKNTRGIPDIGLPVTVIGNGQDKLETDTIVEFIETHLNQAEKIVFWIHTHGSLSKDTKKHYTDDFGSTEDLFKTIGDSFKKIKKPFNGDNLSILFQSCYGGQAIAYVDYFPTGTRMVFTAPASSFGVDKQITDYSIPKISAEKDVTAALFRHFQAMASDEAAPALVVSGKKYKMIHYQSVIKYLNGKQDILEKYFYAAQKWVNSNYTFPKRLHSNRFESVQNNLLSGKFNLAFSGSDSAVALMLADGFYQVLSNDSQASDNLKQLLEALRHDPAYFQDTLTYSNSCNHMFINNENDNSFKIAVCFEKLTSQKINFIVSIIADSNSELKEFKFSLNQAKEEALGDLCTKFSEEFIKEKYVRLILLSIEELILPNIQKNVLDPKFEFELAINEDICKAYEKNNYASVMRIIKKYKLQNNIATRNIRPDQIFSGTIFEHILSHISNEHLLDIKNKDGETLLHSFFKMPNFLAKKIGPSLFKNIHKEKLLNTINKFEQTLFHWAIRFKNKEILQVLLENVSITEVSNIKDKAGKNLLQYCYNVQAPNSSEIITFLLDRYPTLESNASKLVSSMASFDNADSINSPVPAASTASNELLLATPVSRNGLISPGAFKDLS